MRRLIVLVLALASSGCATARQQPPAGDPEVEIPGVGRLRARDALATALAANGWTLHSTTEYSLVAEAKAGRLQNVLLGNARAVRRATYTFIDAPGGVRIVAYLAVVSNPGERRERVAVMRDLESRRAMQTSLLELRESFPVTSTVSAGDVQQASSSLAPREASPELEGPTRCPPFAVAALSRDGGWERMTVARSGAIEGVDAGIRVRVVAPTVSREPIEGLVVGWRSDTVFVGCVERAGIWTLPLAAIEQVRLGHGTAGWQEAPIPAAGARSRRQP